MQEYEIRQRFSRVERAIGEAAQACSAERDLPGELRDCIHKLDRQADAAQQGMAPYDVMRLRRMVEELGALGDRARRVVSNMPALTPQMRSAVQHVHDELVELRHDLR
jgi:hypothetical protein